MTAADARSVLTVHEIATLLRVSPMSVYRLIHDRKLRAYRIGRTYRVRADDFTDFMDQGDTWREEG